MADEAKRIDETVPGGRYLAADRKTFVDAWGRPLEDAPTEEAPASDSGEQVAESPAPRKRSRTRQRG